MLPSNRPKSGGIISRSIILHQSRQRKPTARCPPQKMDLQQILNRNAPFITWLFGGGGVIKVLVDIAVQEEALATIKNKLDAMDTNLNSKIDTIDKKLSANVNHQEEFRNLAVDLALGGIGKLVALWIYKKVESCTSIKPSTDWFRYDYFVSLFHLPIVTTSFIRAFSWIHKKIKTTSSFLKLVCRYWKWQNVCKNRFEFRDFIILLVKLQDVSLS